MKSILAQNTVQIFNTVFTIISDESTHKKSQQVGNNSRRGSTATNTVTRKITLYHQETAKGAPEFGYGIRVVGQLDSNLTVGRVLWINPGGPAHVGGNIKSYQGFGTYSVPNQKLKQPSRQFKALRFQFLF